MDRMLIPQYNGSETTNEDIVYSFFRLVMNNKGYSFRVKRTGYIEVDSIREQKEKGHAMHIFFRGKKQKIFSDY